MKLHRARFDLRWKGPFLFLLLLFFAQAVAGIPSLSLTYDEPIYIGVGYADWMTRDVYWHEHVGHPPLVNLLTAWPLLLNPDRPAPRDLPQWGSNDVLGFSRQLLLQLGPLDCTAFLTRLPVVWIALLLGTVVFRWATDLWGRKGGLLALVLFTLDPTVMAHACLNTTDMGLAAFGLLACYALARFLQRPTAKRLVLAGLALGLPLASKASGSFYLGIAEALLSAFAVLAWRKKRRWLWRWLVSGTTLAGLALLVLWAAYLFEVRPVGAGGIPLPAASHWLGLPYIRSYMRAGQTTFLWGQIYEGNQPWGYFPLAFLIKTPLPTLLFLILAAGSALRRGTPFGQDDPLGSRLVLIGVPLAYFFFATMMALQIGHRHLLPIYPFIFVFSGQLAHSRLLRRRATWRRAWRLASIALLLLLLGWLAFSSLSIWPFQLAYFNELVGGADHGYRYLADSSVDWGQNLKALRHDLETRGIPRPRLAAFSSLDPALYGLRFEPLPPTVGAPITMTARFNPAPGIYAISAVPLQGIWVLDPDTYDWFRRREPVARVGHAVFVYQVEPPLVSPLWVAQCAAPSLPLSPTQVEEGFGISGLRLIAFDCRHGWLYPANGPGWYVLPGDQAEDAWVQRALTQARLSYVQREHWSHPALTIYFWDSADMAVSPPATLAHLPSQGGPPNQGLALTAPMATTGPLTFLGYDVRQGSVVPGDVVELTTFWRVEEVPGRSLSLMAHLVGPDGRPIAVGDGLGVPIDQWRPGDVIVQRHRLEVPEETPGGAYWLQTGAYWLDTMERWKVSDAQVADAIFLSPMAVE